MTGQQHEESARAADSVAHGDSLLKAGKTEAALQVFQALLEERTVDGLNKKRRSQVLLGMARANHMSGRLDDALESYYQSLEEAGTQFPDQAADACMGIGIVSSQTGDYQNAITFLSRAEQSWKKRDIRRLQILINTANVYLDADSQNQVEPLYKEALDLAGEIRAPAAKASILTNLSNYSIKRASWDASKEYAERSLQLRDSLRMPQHVKTMNNLAYSEVRRGHLSEGILLYERALPLANLEERKQLLWNLKEAMMLSGRPNEALTYFESFTETSDSLNRMAYDQKVSELQELYRAKESQLKIAELERTAKEKNQRILVIVSLSLLSLVSLGYIAYLRFKSFKSRKEIEQAKTQDKLFRAQLNPHFIFNALQNVQHYIFNAEKEASMSYLKSFSMLIRTLLQHSASEWVALDEELEMLNHYLILLREDAKNAFNYRIQVAPDLETDSIMIPPFLIQPFVENAVKHGIRSVTDGFVTLALSRSANTLVIEIKDNGVGQRVADLPGADSLTKSMGIGLITERVRSINLQHKGLIDLSIQTGREEVPFPGFSVNLRIKLLEELTWIES